jgi:hypothetical protein
LYPHGYFVVKQLGLAGVRPRRASLAPTPIGGSTPEVSYREDNQFVRLYAIHNGEPEALWKDTTCSELPR